MFNSVRGILCSLRRPNLEDVDTMTRWMSDPYLNSTVFDSTRFIGDAEEQAMAWIEENTAVYGGDSLIVLAETNSNNHPVGLVWFENIDWRSRTADLRYLVGEADYRTSLFGPEIALLALQLAFRTLNLHKIYGYVLSDNVDSIKLAEFGAIREGVLRNYVQTDNGWNDYHLFAMFNSGFDTFLEQNKEGVLRRHYAAGLLL